MRNSIRNVLIALFVAVTVIGGTYVAVCIRM